MEIFSSLVFILLTLFGYSSGASQAYPTKRMTPRLWDVFSAFLLCIGAVATRDLLNRWLSLPVWIAAGLLCGFALSKLRKDVAGLPDLPAVQVNGLPFWRGLWERWLHFSHRAGNYQSRLLLAGLYFTLVLPFGLITIFFVDPLSIRKPRADTGWRAWEALDDDSLEAARRQF